MKKKDILKILLGGAKFVPGPIGMVAGGIDDLIHRDADPTNDLEETATETAKLVAQVVAAAEDLSDKDFVNNAALRLLTDHMVADLTFYVQAVHALKPVQPVQPVQ